MSAQSAPIRGSHSLEFFNGQILYRSTNGHGEQIKFLSPATVAAAFAKAPLDSGWLPAGVVRCGHAPLGSFAVFFIPAQKTAITIEGRARSLSVNLPPFVFFGIGPSYYVWTIKENKFTAGAEIYAAPLPNVFGDGRICWGTNKPPKASAGTIAEAWKLFITSPFTDHAANDKSRSHRNDVRRLLIKLARSRSPGFPVRELLPHGATLDRTVDHILRDLQK